MDIPDYLNIVTILMVFIFILPILIGIIRSFSRDQVQHSVVSFINNIEFLLSILLSLGLLRIISDANGSSFLTGVYTAFQDISQFLSGKEVWANAVLFVFLVIFITCILRLATIPVYRFAVIPVSNSIASKIDSMGGFAKRFISGLWQIPKSIWLVLVFSLLLSIYTGFKADSFIAESAGNSVPYRFIEESIIEPVLESSVVKNFQVLLNDSFKDTVSEVSDIAKKRLVRYFNGTTLDEAVASTPNIDAAAKKITGTETDSKKKAYLIYKWIAGNIKYDYGKAKTITADPSKVSSGAKVAFKTKTGVCFDYACLYVAMCRAVDVKVRFITGLGYTGEVWGDHAWNQAYDPGKDAWVNVDSTFGASGINYFNKANFNKDHKDGELQGEW